MYGKNKTVESISMNQISDKDINVSKKRIIEVIKYFNRNGEIIVLGMI
jgi:hypothetical protein